MLLFYFLWSCLLLDFVLKHQYLLLDFFLSNYLGGDDDLKSVEYFVGFSVFEFNGDVKQLINCFLVTNAPVHPVRFNVMLSFVYVISHEVVLVFVSIFWVVVFSFPLKELKLVIQ